MSECSQQRITKDLFLTLYCLLPALTDLAHVYTPARSLRSSSDTHIFQQAKAQYSLADQVLNTGNSLSLEMKYEKTAGLFFFIKKRKKTTVFVQATYF